MKKIVALALVSLAGITLAGCRQDMHNQPKYIPLRESGFFKDGRSARMPVANTIARGNLRDDTYFYTGKVNGVAQNELPERLLKQDFKSMDELLARGQNRFNIYCTPCHSRVGDGNGMIAQRAANTGATVAFRPASYHEERLKKMPLGYFYDTITNGFGMMLNYSAQIPPQDRWAIAAYIRVLQLSQDAKLEDVPESERKRLEKEAGVQPAPDQAKEGVKK